MRAIRQLFTLSLCLSVIAACTTPLFSRTIYVPAGKAVQLRVTIEKAAVWVKTEKGEVVPGTMDLPEGWYVLPDPGEK